MPSRLLYVGTGGVDCPRLVEGLQTKQPYIALSHCVRSLHSLRICFFLCMLSPRKFRKRSLMILVCDGTVIERILTLDVLVGRSVINSYYYQGYDQWTTQWDLVEPSTKNLPRRSVHYPSSEYWISMDWFPVHNSRWLFGLEGRVCENGGGLFTSLFNDFGNRCSIGGFWLSVRTVIWKWRCLTITTCALSILQQ